MRTVYQEPVQVSHSNWDRSGISLSPRYQFQRTLIFYPDSTPTPTATEVVTWAPSPHPRKYFISDNTLAYTTTPDPSAISDFYLTPFQSTNKQGAISQNIPPRVPCQKGEVSTGNSSLMVSSQFHLIRCLVTKFSSILKDHTTYVRILHHARTLTFHES